MRRPRRSDMPLFFLAFTILRRGEPLPVDIALKLAARGFDVPRLEARFAA